MSNDVNTNSVTNSRLLSSTSILRDTLYTRNLYTPNSEYPIINNSNTTKVVNAINSVIGALTPFKSYNLNNTFYGRLITNHTPLTDVGLVMLGKQFALNSMSQIAHENLPSIKISNVLEGKNIFTPNINFSITNKTSLSTFEQFLDKIIYYYPNRNYPFNKKSDNSDYIKNSGTGQLNILYSQLNNNIYKSSDQTLISYGIKIEKPLQPRNNLVANKIYFNFDSSKENPYLNFHPKTSSVVQANSVMSLAYNNTSNTNVGQEYAPNADFINSYMGKPDKSPIKNDISKWVDSYTDEEFSNNNIKNKLVWGRDGVASEANNKLSQLQGDSGDQTNYLDENITSFNVRVGLLEYTKNLLNASEGNVVDITRKAFKRGNEVIGFNGSPLYKANNSTYANNSGIAGKQGIRQHTILDQYDRYAKAIRFNGNNVYGGNKDSVIYNTVMPRIHPTLDKNGKVDNKNLMFSIENLAIGVISQGNFGIIDDEYGTTIPLSEVGPFNGRLMWFPPYNVEINEVASAKYESTLLVGRNEPMYNYINSERTATLSFTLLVDYPEQLKNYYGQNKHKEIADFFAFGGDSYFNKVTTINDLELKQAKLKNEILSIEGNTVTAEPPPIENPIIKAIFPNNVPKVNDSINTIFDKMYKEYKYEITDRLMSSDGTGFGLNKDIYVPVGIVESGQTKYLNLTTLPPDFSEYNQTDLNCLLNKVLNDVYSNIDNCSLYDINIIGHASNFYRGADEKTYDDALGQRRADATKFLINSRLIALFGKDYKTLGININTSSTGSAGFSPSTADDISKEDIKNQRFAEIKITRNNKKTPPKKTQLSKNDEDIIAQKKNEIENIQTQINNLKQVAYDGIYSETKQIDADSSNSGGILGGFKSISGNYYYPVFHSQTPEDFHKRLTFLNQCTRQGAAKRYSTIDSTGNLSAKNSVFGRQPFCILRIGDFFYTKVIIETVTVDYSETTWDMNPEGFGMQPMLAKVTLQMKVIGGQSLKGPIDALQNAVSFNYYANSTFTDKGTYLLPSAIAAAQEAYKTGILTPENQKIIENFNNKNAETKKLLADANANKNTK